METFKVHSLRANSTLAPSGILVWPRQPLPTSVPWTTKVVFTLGCLWNLLAPLKAWGLSRYGFVPTSSTVVQNLNWDSELNGAFLTSLYAAAGIDSGYPRNATRYINVVLDFLVAPRSSALWATGYANSSHVYQMSLNGRPRRQSLNASRELRRFAHDLPAFTALGFGLWGSERLFSALPPVADDCGVQDVAEAVLCLKGVSMQSYVNLQYTSPLSPSSNADDAAAVAAWEALIFPDLAACLRRRAQLVAAMASEGAALVALVHELSANYSLSVVNVAGAGLLYAPVTFTAGFLDISGARAGKLTYQLMGRDPAAVYLVGSGHLDSIFVSRETAWFCAIQYVDPITRQKDATQCFARVGATLPAFFAAKYIATYSGTRYIDNADVVPSAMVGNVTLYTWRSVPTRVDDRRVPTQGTWTLLWQDLISSVHGSPRDTAAALEEFCLVGDGCFHACLNETASSGMTLTYMRGGVCISAPNTILYDANAIFTDAACFGRGDHHVQVTYLDGAGVRRRAVANHTAGPLGILACLIGGRPPSIELPSYVMEMLTQGPQATIAITVANGSETITLNFLSLLSLLGQVYFAVSVALHMARTQNWAQLSVQARYSRATCNVGSVVWIRHRTAMCGVGFLGLLTWHIGAMRCGCEWRSDAMSYIKLDPSYVCAVDPWGHMSNGLECLRLLSFAWTFFAMASMDKVPGVTRHWQGYLMVVVLLGFVPLTVLAALVGYCMTLRSTYFPIVHSQFVLVALWCTVLTVLRSALAAPYMRLVEACLLAVGLRPQRIDRRSLFHGLIGNVYWTSAASWHETPACYVPLSLLFKTDGVHLNYIHDHAYYPNGVVNAVLSQHPHPDWVETEREYYVCARM
ncbi:hypothetical protein SDRG_08855 [Saprolegnia diclina VS20]|uniref:Uncharacterized protein n=1 Tax=Saprolegnia diclina (strain VS20) TaxID=1156394 RepID=T0RN26_SAPDV|nr:hypothetical protein SDRG_08855 [Saprolegnia diclina VS20]EQC33753.1 hypothetical protein SDRG_08855 [Saprolegnia diclina VS20]|eukprot:XP_008612976.1 hypothetical protein SDRG_08855 [Saprolegnia diclina VS20]